MFIEVNTLRALIIDLPVGVPLNHWRDLSYKFTCAFLVNNDQELNDLKNSVSPNSSFLLKQGIFFMRYSVLNAMALLDVQPYESAFVTSNTSALTNMLDEPMGTILLTESFQYENVGSLPDLYATDPKDLEVSLEQYPGYLGELFTTIVNEKPVRNRGKIFSFKFDYDTYSFEVASLGRYFGQRHHKNRLHQFSLRLRKNKTEESQTRLFSSLISPLLIKTRFTGITRVPPRPSETKDRFIPIIQELSAKYSLEDLSNSLKSTHDFPKQKDQSNREERRANVKGVFQASPNVVDKDILLIDDIFTTGSTVGECASTLLKSGAKSVTILVLAVNQPYRAFPNRKDLPCPNNCGGTMVLRINKSGIGAFFGCSNFFNGTCNKIIPFQQAAKKINFQNSRTNEEVFSDDLIF